MASGLWLWVTFGGFWLVLPLSFRGLVSCGVWLLVTLGGIQPLTSARGSQGSGTYRAQGRQGPVLWGPLFHNKLNRV